MMGVISSPPCQHLRGQNKLLGIGLTGLIEPSDILNYKLFFKHCTLQTIFHVFLLFIFVWNKTLEQNFLFKKQSHILHLPDLIWGSIRC